MHAKLSNVLSNASRDTGHRRRLLARSAHDSHGPTLVLVDARGEKHLAWRWLDIIEHGQHEVDATLTAAGDTVG